MGDLESTKKCQTKLRDIIQEAKHKPCMDCKQIFPYFIMQFDHREGEVKSFSIGKVGMCRSLESLIKEIAKCDVVCANCHARRTYVRMFKGVTNGRI